MRCDNCGSEGFCECQVTKGVGTRLKEIIPNRFQSEGCECGDLAREMDLWGPDGCQERFDGLVGYLVGKAKAWHVPEAAAKVMAKRWLKRAIKEAREG